MARYEIQVDDFPAQIRPDRRSAANSLRHCVYERISAHAGRDTRWGRTAYLHGEALAGAVETAPLIVGECVEISIGGRSKITVRRAN
jgi:hypothetical protein